MKENKNKHPAHRWEAIATYDWDTVSDTQSNVFTHDWKNLHIAYEGIHSKRKKKKEKTHWCGICLRQFAGNTVDNLCTRKYCKEKKSILIAHESPPRKLDYVPNPSIGRPRYYGLGKCYE